MIAGEGSYNGWTDKELVVHTYDPVVYVHSSFDVLLNRPINDTEVCVKYYGGFCTCCVPLQQVFPQVPSVLSLFILIFRVDVCLYLKAMRYISYMVTFRDTGERFYYAD